MANEKITQLPTVVSATVADIIYAVQAGVSVQMTMQQVLNLVSSSAISSYAGNPNGNVAGTVNQLLWNTVSNNLWICTVSGTISTAVWKNVYFNWNTINTTSTSMSTNNGYFANNSSLVSLSLPLVSAVGDPLSIVGMGAGGWSITQAAGQQIIIGSSATTVGVGGSLSSTNQHDSINLICSVANTTWIARGAPQGVLTIV